MLIRKGEGSGGRGEGGGLTLGERSGLCSNLRTPILCITLVLVGRWGGSGGYVVR